MTKSKISTRDLFSPVDLLPADRSIWPTPIARPFPSYDLPAELRSSRSLAASKAMANRDRFAAGRKAAETRARNKAALETAAAPAPVTPAPVPVPPIAARVRWISPRIAKRFEDRRTARTQNRAATFAARA